ncbi:hypothetical protein GCM10009826_36950 [Humibacillus xanthopallidus]
MKICRGQIDEDTSGGGSRRQCELPGVVAPTSIAQAPRASTSKYNGQPQSRIPGATVAKIDAPDITLGSINIEAEDPACAGQVRSISRWRADKRLKAYAA